VVALAALAATTGCRNVGKGGAGGGDADTDTDTDTDSSTGEVDCEEIPDYCCAEGCPCGEVEEDCIFPDASWDVDEDIGVCKGEPPSGECWSDDDCGAGTYCAGESVCPCSMECYAEWTGICIGISAGCCDNQADVPCEEDQICIEMGELTDTCHPALDYPLCWTDDDCQNGPCVEETLCPCDDDDCESVPGLCADEN